MSAYQLPTDNSEIASLVPIKIIRENLYNLSVPLYVAKKSSDVEQDLEQAVESWKISRVRITKYSAKLFSELSDIVTIPSEVELH
mgnify:FL=1